MPPTAALPPDAVLQLRIQLRDLEPPITRVVAVPARFTFGQLHRVIQAVLPWLSSHLHEFETPEGLRIGELHPALEEANPQRAEDEVHLREHLAKPGDEINYQYDFGDSWDHQITVEAVCAPEPGTPTPRLLSGARAAPPEDSGGTPGYEGILLSLRSPEPDPELLAWLPRGFDPARFDLEAARRRLARVFRAKGKGFQVLEPTSPAPAPAPPDHNPWCERLGVPVPQVEALARKKGVMLIQLMVGALLERGAPMTLTEVAQRLAAAGVSPATGDLPYSLRRAWKGQTPVVEGGDGRLRLDLDASRLRTMLWELGLRQRAQRQHALPAVAPPPPKGDEVPLCSDELEIAFRGRSLYAVTSLRQAAAVLDVAGTALRWEVIEARLAALSPYRHKLNPPESPSWWKGLVSVQDGMLTLNRDDPGLGSMRRAVRKLAEPVAALALQAEQRAAALAEATRLREERARLAAQKASATRRALVIALPDAAHPQALALLDLGDGSVMIWTGGRLSEAAGALERYDLIAAPQARALLEALSLDPERWRLADLKPPQRTLQRAGRVLWLTPELMLTSTLGIQKPLPDPEAVTAALTSGDERAIERLLRATLRVYHALYTYGLLQHSVLVRHGRNLETLPVDWALPGDPHLWSVLNEAEETGRPVAFVIGKLPPGLDLFATARQGTFLSKDRWTVTLLEGGAPVALPREKILAARLA